MAAPSTRPQVATQRNYVDYDEFVEYQLDKTRGTIKTTEIVTTLTSLAAGIVGYLLLFVILDQWVFEEGFGVTARLVMLLIAGGCAVYVFARHVVWPTLRKIHPLYAARVIERADPKLKSTLLNFVDLRQSQLNPAPGVLRAIERRAAVALDRIDVDEAVDRKLLLRVAYVLLAVVTAAAFYLVFSPKDPFVSVRRALFPMASIAPATETEISDVTPGDDRVPARTVLSIEADVRGKPVDQVRILYTTVDHKYVDQPVEMHRIDPELPRYRGVLSGENGRGLLQDLRYVIEAGDARTRAFQVEVVQPPSAQVTGVHYEYPKYMQLEPRTTPGGAIDGWEGATVTVTAEANMPVRQARLVLTDTDDAAAKGEEIAMQIAEGTKLSATWRLEFRADGTYARHYHVRVSTEKRESDPEPATYPVRIRPDQRPEIALLYPTGDLEKPANAIVPLHLVASDPDFLLRSITLKCEKNGEELPDERLFEDREPLGQSLRATHEMRLSRLRLQPGDRLQYWVEAKDNKQPVANRGSTPRMNITILPPQSANEVARQLAQDQQQLQNQLAQAPEDPNPGRPDQEPGDKEPPSDDAQTQRPPDGQRRGNNVAQPPEDQNREEPTAEPGEEAGQRPGQPDDPHGALQRRIQKLLDRDRQERQEPKVQESDQPPVQSDESTESDGDASEEAGNGQAQRNGGQRQGSKPGAAGQSARGAGQQPDGSQSQHSDDGASPDSDGQGATEKPAQRGSTSRQGPGKSPGQPPQARPGGQDELRRDGQDPQNEGPPDDAAQKSANNKQDQPGQRGGAKSSNTGSKSDRTKSTSQGADSGKDQSPDGEASDDDSKPASGGSRDNEDQSGPPDSKAGKNQSSKPHDGGARRPNDQPSGASENGQDAEGSNGESQAQPGQQAGNQKSDPRRGSQTDSTSKPPGARGETGKKPDSPPGSGQHEPADDSAGATRDNTDQPGPGKVEGSDEQDPQAPEAPDGLKPDPGSKPGVTQPGNQDSPNDRPPQGARRGSKEDSGNQTTAPDAKRGQPAPRGKNSSERPGATEEHPSKGSQPGSRKPASQRPSDPSELGNQPREGTGRKQGQKSDQPQAGEEGSSGTSDEGQTGGNTKGAGDQSSEPGDQEPSDSATGRPGAQKGRGSGGKKSDPSGAARDAQGSDSSDGNQGKNQGKNGSSGGKESAGGGGKSSSSQSRAGSPGDSGASSAGGGVSDLGKGSGPGPDNSGDAEDGDGAPRPPRSPGSPDEEPTPEELDAARLENARKATNLVLRKLKQKLERGDVDDELMRELGWQDLRDLEKFVTQLEESLTDKREGESPEELARRKQFEELLKGLRLGSETAGREGGKTPQRRIQQIDARRRPVPAELRELYEAYTKGLSKEKPPANAKNNK